jgi:hypothetical protein
MTPSEVGKVLGFLSATYQRRVEPDTVAAWSLLLAEEPAAPIAAAAREHAMSSTFFPSIAELVTLA